MGELTELVGQDPGGRHHDLAGEGLEVSTLHVPATPLLLHGPTSGNWAQQFVTFGCVLESHSQMKTKFVLLLVANREQL